MATPAADPGEGVPIVNGTTKLADKALSEDTLMEDIIPTDKPNGAKISAAKPHLTSGPPNLHPTITTWQWLFSASDMQYTPSVIQSKYTVEQEKHFRWKGVQLIYRIGEYLRLGSHVTCTAAIYFHRFYMRKALPRESREKGIDAVSWQEMAPTCVFLACKVEETHRKARDVVEATMAVLDRSPNGILLAEARNFKPDQTSKEYGRWRDIILLFEERLLDTLCFDLIVEQPHAIAIKACIRLKMGRDMIQVIVVLLNAILQGAVSVFYDAAVLAAAAFQKACILVEVDPASFLNKTQYAGTWYDVFDVDQEEVDEATLDFDEQLMFHNERINLSRPSHPTPAQLGTPLGNTTSPNTPLRMETDTSAPATSASPRRHTHFESENDAAEVKKRNGYSTQKTPSWSDDEGETNRAGTSTAENLNDSRPMSRHGSKGASLGPPPPLGILDSKAVEQMEKDPQSAVSDSKAAAELKEEAQPAISDSKAVVEMKGEERANERVAAVKVHQEQLQQEEVQREEADRERAKFADQQHADAQPEEGEVESEEEGAL